MAGTTLETTRLIGEPVSGRHREVALALFGDPQVAAWIWPGERGGPRSPEQVDEILARFAADWREHGYGWWYLAERTSGQYVGEVALQMTAIEGQPMVEVGWTMLPAYWNRGYATEAAWAALAHGFGPCGLEEIVSVALPHNKASRRVMEKLGMTYERDIEHAGLPHVLYRLAAPYM